MRGDTGPTNHTGGTLTPTYSVLSSGSYGGTNSTTAPPVVSQYCNGSRVPPECTVANGCGGPKGFGVPPGIADAVTPNPLFSLAPAATVDEGNNWINVSWGPLALTNPSLTGGVNGNYGGGPALANYNLTAAIDSVPASQPHPFTDFYGNLRPEPGESFTTGSFDPGAIEFGSALGNAAQFSVSPTTLAFGNQAIATTSGPMTITVTNTGALALTGGTFTFTGSTTFTRSGGSCTATLAVGANCTVSVVFRPTVVGTNYTGSLAFAYTAVSGPATGTGTPVSLSGTGVAAGPLAFTSATNATCCAVSGGAQTLTFTIPANRASVTSVVTIRNNGPATSTPVTITAESVAGTGTASTLFTLNSTTCGATLAPGATCTITITYATPVAAPPPTAPNVGTAAVTNNGSGTANGSTNLRLVGR